ncbi:hypothetical protein XA68_12340 [Ophiocordyceps unilateralis]|uniref:Altered inheritance of mitochondria protein 32 n=1 Tax=Ophiocordyceps unilateralis TaxID=268505 RepID=A0A2A9PVR4_OPHUN|nr:hypothetical protein XA68_12340 [Ophiocordyceps unilateralis]
MPSRLGLSKVAKGDLEEAFHLLDRDARRQWLPSPQRCAGEHVSSSGLSKLHDGSRRGYIRFSYLDDTVPPYREQVVICTGVTSWEPKIDDENNKDNLARDISQMLKKAGEDLPNDARLPRITVLNASFPSSWSKRRAIPSNSVYLFPSFKYVPRVIRTRPDFDTDPTHLQRSIFSAEALMERCVLPYFPKSHMTPNFLHDGIRHDVYMEFDKNLQDVEDVVVLICGHDRVDWRCGVMGPLLVREFNNQLVKAGLDVRDDRVFVPKSGSWKDYRSKRGDVVQAARVGLVSHVGGHKFAGNVIIYLPPDMKMNEKPHPLAGHGVCSPIGASLWSISSVRSCLFTGTQWQLLPEPGAAAASLSVPRCLWFHL